MMTMHRFSYDYLSGFWHNISLISDLSNNKMKCVNKQETYQWKVRSLE